MAKFFFFYFFLVSFNLFSQTIDETIILADKMFEEKDYIGALGLYKRASFFSKDSKNYLFEKCGDCYYMQQKYKNAFNLYDSAFKYRITEETLPIISFKKADCLIFLKNYVHAEKLLNSIDSDHYSESFYKKNFYLAVVNFAKEDYEKAEQFFLQSFPDSIEDSKRQIQEIFQNKKKFNRPNPKVAGIMSLVIPGSGQLYAGDYKNALNSFLLLAGFAAIGTDMYIRYAWYDSLVTVSPWFFRYYTGGAKNTVKIAEEKRKDKLNKVLNEIIRITEH